MSRGESLLQRRWMSTSRQSDEADSATASAGARASVIPQQVGYTHTHRHKLNVVVTSPCTMSCDCVHWLTDT